MTMPFMRLLTVAALAAALGGAAAARADDAAPPAPTAPQLPSIYVVKAARQPITDAVLASGYVYPVDEVYVQPQVEGLAVDSSAIEVGDVVKKGAVMAVLSDASLKLEKSQLQANLAKADAALAQAQAQVVEAQANADQAVRVRNRYATLSKNGTISSADSDQATASADAANAQLNAARQTVAVDKAAIEVARAQIDDVDLRLARTAVKAPVDGVVSAKNLKVGAIASASGTPLFTIIRDGALELRADVSEEDLLKLKPGMPADITLPGRPSALSGHVRRVDPTVDLTTRLGTVRVSFDDPSQIRAGMFASARIIAERTDAVVLPVSAVSIDDGKATVLKFVDGRVHVTPVTVGIRENGRLQIAQGLAADDAVVAKAGAFVRDGDRIHPVPITDAALAAASSVTAVGD